MVRYNAVEDPLCYPGTRVLRNKANVEDQDLLDEFEQLMFDSRASETLPEGDLDFAHYRELHRRFFQDVYGWAGELRTIRTARAHLASAESKDAFAEGAAWFLAEINAVHPFREGNGRIQLVFLTLLTRHAGYELDDDKLQPEPFLKAMIKRFSDDLGPLVAEIRRVI